MDAGRPRSPVPVALDVAGEASALPDALAAAVYFVASEALANVAKHARASRAATTVRLDGETATVSVSDDSVGQQRPHRAGNRRQRWEFRIVLQQPMDVRLKRFKHTAFGGRR